MRRTQLLFVLLSALGVARLGAQPSRVIDAFESLAGWESAPSDGVTLRMSLDDGLHGRALRLDFDFHGGGGYAVFRKNVDLDLPANYAFSWQMRGAAPRNNLEFKLVDPSGENVWWSNQRDFAFPASWTDIQRKKRHIEFAWGPVGGGDLAHVRSIEFAITAGSGGKGTVWIDDFQLTELPAAAATPPAPVATATDGLAGTSAMAAVDGDSTTAWRADGPSTLDIDLGVSREFGGLTLRWEPGRIPAQADVETSSDGRRWSTVRRIRDNARLETPIRLPEHEARYVRVVIASGSAGVRDVSVHPLDWAATPNDFMVHVAATAPRGAFPRGFHGEQSYWTVIGVDGDRNEALMSADGAIEVGKGEFSVEPLVVIDGTPSSWSDVEAIQSLRDGSLPMPRVVWKGNGFTLQVDVFAAGPVGASRLYATYRLTNTGPKAARTTLALTIRPLQVNPPWQFLQVIGGVAPVRSIAFGGSQARVNGERLVSALVLPSRVGASGFDAGEPFVQLQRGAFPRMPSVRDELGLASGMMTWDATLAPGASRTVTVEIPLYPQPSGASRPVVASQAAVERLRESTARRWDASLSHTSVSLPDVGSGRAVVETLRASLAYILVNRDGPGLQPGSRSYERSWIRDGALTSTALLRLGHAREVRDFITWYAGFQYANGKIPCCVDQRGADPVPEHDSHGEFIYLVAEYWRDSGDSAFARAMWPRVARAVAYMDSLRRQRLTPIYDSPDSNHFHGILPPSISHEGYSAKPMHSYWDDFFAMRGFKDAATLAQTLGVADAGRYAAMRDEFRRDLVASIRRSMEKHRIDFIPGAADLGDFDATSTTIAVSPVDEVVHLPEGALESTFERYWQESLARREGTKAWENYTPYELRTVGSLVRLGEPERAHALLDFFLRDQRPSGWREWAEVVWRDPRTPKFIGDMPHTWVASDFIRSALDLFAYEREGDSSLVVGAGIPGAWIDGPGVSVRNLRTHYGALDLRMAITGSLQVQVDIALDRRPPGGVVLRPPIGAAFGEVGDGSGPLRIEPDGSVRLRAFPSRVTFTVRRAAPSR